MTTQIISSQRYLDDAIVDAKRAAKDYTVTLSPEFEHEGESYRTVMDGHHAMAAAKEDGAEIVYINIDPRHDALGLLKQGDVDGFLAATWMDSDWYNVETGATIW